MRMADQPAEAVIDLLEILPLTHFFSRFCEPQWMC